MKNCNCGCPLKVVDEYNKLKQDTAEDFLEYVKRWFINFPHVENVYIRRKDSVWQSLFIYKSDMTGNIVCDVKFKE